ncbi:MAG: carboxypeptidase-like regulatory domain-containing protein [Tannerella sp.]|nr:carboxypeptidase-like regulatory domain-containing protein [Tannerella sp.]
MKKALWIWSFLLPALLLLSCSKTEVDTFGNIYGIVTDTGGNPVQAASVTLTPGGLVTTTGSNGQYEYLHLAPAQYTVQVISAGYQTDVKRVTVYAAETVQGDFMLNRVIGAE